MRLIVGPRLLYPFKKVFIFFYGENQINPTMIVLYFTPMTECRKKLVLKMFGR